MEQVNNNAFPVDNGLPDRQFQTPEELEMLFERYMLHNRKYVNTYRKMVDADVPEHIKKEYIDTIELDMELMERIQAAGSGMISAMDYDVLVELREFMAMNETRRARLDSAYEIPRFDEQDFEDPLVHTQSMSWFRVFGEQPSEPQTDSQEGSSRTPDDENMDHDVNMQDEDNSNRDDLHEEQELDMEDDEDATDYDDDSEDYDGDEEEEEEEEEAEEMEEDEEEEGEEEEVQEEVDDDEQYAEYIRFAYVDGRPYPVYDPALFGDSDEEIDVIGDGPSEEEVEREIIERHFRDYGERIEYHTVRVIRRRPTRVVARVQSQEEIDDENKENIDVR